MSVGVGKGVGAGTNDGDTLRVVTQGAIGDTTGDCVRGFVVAASAALMALTVPPSFWWFDPPSLRHAGLLDAEWPAGRGVIRRLRAMDPGIPGFWALRHYQRGGLVARWLHDRYLYTGLRRTRAWRELALLTAMRAAGLPVPVPIAVRIMRSGIGYRADILTEWVQAADSVDSRLRRGPLPPGVWARIGACIQRFHAAGFCHADLNSRNILLDAEEQVWVLDWDRGRRRRAGPWQQANVNRLRHDLEKRRRQGQFCGYADTDFADFLSGYRTARTAEA